jgi:hypothetical protein
MLKNKTFDITFSSIPARIHRTAGGGFLHLCPIPKETLNWLKEPS